MSLLEVLELLIFLEPLFIATFILGGIYLFAFGVLSILEETWIKPKRLFTAMTVVILSAQLMNISWAIDRVNDFKEGRESRTPGALMELIDEGCTCKRD